MPYDFDFFSRIFQVRVWFKSIIEKKWNYADKTFRPPPLPSWQSVILPQIFRAVKIHPPSPLKMFVQWNPPETPHWINFSVWFHIKFWKKIVVQRCFIWFFLLKKKKLSIKYNIFTFFPFLGLNNDFFLSFSPFFG